MQLDEETFVLLEEISQVEDLVDELGEEEDNGDIIDT